MNAFKNTGTNSYFLVQVITGNTEINIFELKLKIKNNIINNKYML